MKAIYPLALVLALPTLLSAATMSNYQHTVMSQGPSAYFKLDGDYNDAVTSGQTLTPYLGYFGTDAARHLTNAYVFNNSSDALALANDIIPGGDPTGTNSSANAVGSISLLFRTLDSNANTGQRFVFSQGVGTTTNGNALALFFEGPTSTNLPNSLKLRVGANTTTILASNLIVADEWYYFAMTYNEARYGAQVIWYLGLAGGTLNSGTNDIGTYSVVGDNGTVVLGNTVNLASGYRDPGNGRVDEFAVWTRELSANEVAAQFAQLYNYLPANVTYQTLITAQNPAYYFKLDNSTADSITGLVLSTNGTAGTFTTNVLGVANSAYQFSQTNDALLITNDIIPGGGTSSSAANGSGTISFLFRALAGTNTTGQRFIFSQGAGTSGNQNQLALFLENTNSLNGDPTSLKLRVGNGPTTTILQSTNIITNAWYYFAMTYDENRDSQSGGEVRYYLGPVGGSLTNGAVDIANTAVIGDNGTVYLGNNNSLKNAYRNPGAGAIDEFAIWNDELSPTEIAAQFAAVTYTVPQPRLQAMLALPNVVLFWATNNADGFVLESTPSLPNSNPVWSSAGSPSVVGAQYFVTNSAAGRTFYRLRKPTP
ncbi:MAG TPA: LamG-like jellyroll fold domain-containing protein [Candidatus Acidoferrum sp.]|nr:LamG-like jellyroll fold domain-containing protein [Candidatus Acidoferrum sp.]